MLTSRGARGVGQGIGAVLRLGRIKPGDDIGVLASGFASLDTAGSRSAFLHTVRSVIDSQGQRVSAVDRLHLAAVLPTLIVWGEEDSIIPLAHGGARFARSLVETGLIDEYRLVIHPAVLGAGERLFPAPLTIEPMSTTVFSGGAVAHVFAAHP